MEARSRRKERVGVVLSDRMYKTRVVLVEMHIQHPLYKKYIKRRKKFYVHDENNETHVGDVVKIMETRPLSRLKRWRVVNIIRKAHGEA